MASLVKININQEKEFEVSDDLLPLMGKTLNGLVEDHLKESPDTPWLLKSPDVSPEAFENMIEFAKLLSKIPEEQFLKGTDDKEKKLKIDKPLPSPDIKVWLKEYPSFFPFLETLQADKELVFGLLIAGNWAGFTILTDLIGCIIAAHCIGKRVEELREYFDIESDFTPEEEK